MNEHHLLPPPLSAEARRAGRLGFGFGRRFLLLVSKAMAGIDGRDYLIPDDIKNAAAPVLRHRVLLKPEAELEGIDSDGVIRDVLAAVEVPR